MTIAQQFGVWEDRWETERFSGSRKRPEELIPGTDPSWLLQWTWYAEALNLASEVQRATDEEDRVNRLAELGDPALKIWTGIDARRWDSPSTGTPPSAMAHPPGRPRGQRTSDTTSHPGPGAPRNFG
jgi:hypothetical protein